MRSDLFKVALVLVVYPSLIGLLDLWLYLTGRKTITRAVRDSSRRWPIIAALFGALAFGLLAHFFLG